MMANKTDIEGIINRVNQLFHNAVFDRPDVAHTRARSELDWSAYHPMLPPNWEDPMPATKKQARSNLKKLLKQSQQRNDILSAFLRDHGLRLTTESKDLHALTVFFATYVHARADKTDIDPMWRLFIVDCAHYLGNFLIDEVKKRFKRELFWDVRRIAAIAPNQVLYSFELFGFADPKQSVDIEWLMLTAARSIVEGDDSWGLEWMDAIVNEVQIRV